MLVLKIFKNLLLMSLCKCMSVQRPQDSAASPWSQSCRKLCVTQHLCWKSNLGPLEEQETLLTTESFFQSW